MLVEIKTYSELANLILHNETDYFNDKQLIKNIFSYSNKDFQETIRLRLTIIDSFYSTNMSRRYYGILNLSSIILYYYKDDHSLMDALLSFTSDQKNDQILDIFNGSYGINKKGEQKGKAISLFSKYAYFLTNFQFPIYDSIVFKTYPKIVKRFPELSLNKELSKDISGFVSMMNRFNEVSGINNFNKLDNLLWLIGKILRGNFSLIFKESVYEEIVKPINIGTQIESKAIDEKIKDYIFLNLDKLNHLIDNNLLIMIKLAKEINSYNS